MYSRKAAEDAPTSRRVLGYGFEVGKVLGPGSLKFVYEKTLCIKLAERGLQLSIIRLICVHLWQKRRYRGAITQ